MQDLQAMSKTERHFFLRENGKQIYCVEYLPSEKDSNRHGVILCKPIWGERIRTHIIFSNLARHLSNNGFSVITCDYYGDGNSGGETIELNYLSMVEDITLLHHYFAQNYRIDTFSLLGLRLGANVAIGAEPELFNLYKMILFEPFLNPINQFTNALRANLATQMAIHKTILKTRDDLIDDIKKNISVNIDGFVIGKEFWESFERISPLKIESNFDQSAVFYSIAPKGRKGTDYSGLARDYQHFVVKCIEQEFFWDSWKTYVPKPKIFFESIMAELGGFSLQSLKVD